MKDIIISEEAEKVGQAFAKLYQTIVILRGPEGCPWDKTQTLQTLHPHLVEESYELLEGIRNDDKHNICEEIGDVYLVNTMIATVTDEQEPESTLKILNQITEKIIRRHPHVFGEEKATTAEEGRESWTRAKMAEKNINSQEFQGALHRVGRGLPPLDQARKLQGKMSKFGFGWPDADAALAKVKEELGELETEIHAQNQDKIMAELGDVFFALVGLSNVLKVDPSEAIYHTSAKVTDRVHSIEKTLAKEGLLLEEKNRIRMELLWEQTKKL